MLRWKEKKGQKREDKVRDARELSWSDARSFDFAAEFGGRYGDDDVWSCFFSPSFGGFILLDACFFASKMQCAAVI